jgi:hypothetical protein
MPISSAYRSIARNRAAVAAGGVRIDGLHVGMKVSVDPRASAGQRRTKSALGWRAPVAKDGQRRSYADRTLLLWPLVRQDRLARASPVKPPNRQPSPRSEINNLACCQAYFRCSSSDSSSLHQILISVPTHLADILMRILLAPSPTSRCGKFTPTGKHEENRRFPS